MPDLIELTDAAAQPVDLVGHDCVNQAFLNVAEQALELWAIQSPTGIAGVGIGACVGPSALGCGVLLAHGDVGLTDLLLSLE